MTPTTELCLAFCVAFFGGAFSSCFFFVFFSKKKKKKKKERPKKDSSHRSLFSLCLFCVRESKDDEEHGERRTLCDDDASY